MCMFGIRREVGFAVRGDQQAFPKLMKASQVAQLVKNGLPTQETQEMWVQPLGREDPLKRERQPTPVFLPRWLQSMGS